MTFTYRPVADDQYVLLNTDTREIVFKNSPELENLLVSNPDLFHFDPTLKTRWNSSYEFKPDHRLARYTDIMRNHLPNISAELQSCYINYLMDTKLHNGSHPETLGGYYRAGSTYDHYYRDPHISYRLDLILKAYDSTATISDLYTSNVLAPEDYIPLSDYAIGRINSKTLRTLDNLLDVPVLFVHAYGQVMGMLPLPTTSQEKLQYYLARYLYQQNTSK